jgi:hypothetical protein
MWIGVIQAMLYETTGWKQTELCLSYSRDGRHWLRPPDRKPFIPLGDDKSWDADYSLAVYTAPIVIGDDLFIYYASSRNPERDKDPQRHWPIQVGLTRLRRDGFASLNAGETPGRVVTRPLTFEGKSLFVNADIADGGWVKAAVLSRDSKPLADYGLGDAIPLTKGTTKGQLTWASKKQVTAPGEDHRRLVLQLKNAKLYSFWIE